MTILIHPGFHKTATTWLQNVVFAHRGYFRSMMTHEQVHDFIIAPHAYDFDADRLQAEIARRCAGAEDGVIEVLSSEDLSGNILTGSRDSLAIAERLAASINDAKVLLTVRAQQPIAKSIYGLYVKCGGRLPIEEFLSYRPAPGYFSFDFRSLEFDRLASTYASLFGEANVLVLPQELLFRDKREYLRILLEFVGSKQTAPDDVWLQADTVGKSPPTSGIPLIQMANALTSTSLSPSSKQNAAMDALAKGLKSLGYRWRWRNDQAEAGMKDAISVALTGRYHESNARLQKYSPVDLAELGYEMP